ncbi:probable insulin-like peptide 3 [Musca vetustissima]|uniref:probable insulin-like peptide 3 n=1 Tax=Musca vetustissima TaxID=27455 RepID=UPI002AB72293|nr:probable insulin-like peptide 3 [Musca vetustissima]
MKLLSVIVFFAALYEIHSAATRYCGPNLYQILDAVCTNGFNGMQITKKSGKKELTNDLDIFNEIGDVSPFASDSLLNEMFYSDRDNVLAKTRRMRHLNGVYDECCRKGCTMNELLSYCL